VVGLPGGVTSPYFKLLQEANVNGMELREGKGNVYEVRTGLVAGGGVGCGWGAGEAGWAMYIRDGMC
jgi:hypothetical protein